MKVARKKKKKPAKRRPSVVSLARHVLIELYDCDADILDNEGKIRRLLIEAAKRSGATIVAHTFHQFSPYGISGVVVIAESHVTIHTWPEYRYAAVDVFTCGKNIRPQEVHRFLKRELKARKSTVVRLLRGILPVDRTRPA